MDFNFTDWWQKQNNLGRVLIGALALIVLSIGVQIAPPRPSTIDFVISFVVLLITIGLFFLNQKGKTNLAAHLFLISFYLPLHGYYFSSLKANDFFGAMVLASIMVGLSLVTNIIVSKKSTLILFIINVCLLYLSNQSYPSLIKEAKLLQQSLLILLCLGTAFGWAYNRQQKLTKKNEFLTLKDQNLSQENQQIYQQNQQLLAQMADSNQQTKDLLQEIKQVKTQNQQLLQENKHIQQQNEILAQQNKLLLTQNQQLAQENGQLIQTTHQIKQNLTESEQKIETLLNTLTQNKKALDLEIMEKHQVTARLTEAQTYITRLLDRLDDAAPPPFREVHLVGVVGNKTVPTPYNKAGDIQFSIMVVNINNPKELFYFRAILSSNLATNIALMPQLPIYAVGNLESKYQYNIARLNKAGKIAKRGLEQPLIRLTFIQSLTEEDLEKNEAFAEYIYTLQNRNL